MDKWHGARREALVGLRHFLEISSESDQVLADGVLHTRLAWLHEGAVLGRELRTQGPKAHMAAATASRMLLLLLLLLGCCC